METLIRKGNFRITHDFASPCPGVIEPMDFWDLEFRVLYQDRYTRRGCWHTIRCYTSMEEAFNAFDLLTAPDETQSKISTKTE